MTALRECGLRDLLRETRLRSGHINHNTAGLETSQHAFTTQDNCSDEICVSHFFHSRKDPIQPKFNFKSKLDNKANKYNDNYYSESESSVLPSSTSLGYPTIVKTMSDCSATSLQFNIKNRLFYYLHDLNYIWVKDERLTLVRQRP